MRPTRGRFAPSPTGVMHLGNVWTALLAWLAARRDGGAMILRMEDLDPDRSRPEHARRIMRDLAWLGLDWDEGPDKGGPYAPYDQDSRRHLYEAALDDLRRKGLVYRCWCTRAELRATASAPHPGEAEPLYPGTCRDRKDEPVTPGRHPSLRLRIPADDSSLVCFTDLRAGPIVEDLRLTCGDFTVRRTDGVHAYQLAVVVDDAAMRITQVVRSSDLLDSTPRQLLLYRLLGHQAPTFGHVPLLMDPRGVRLSKRQQSLGLDAIQARGTTPQALVGYLAWRAGLVDTPRPVAPSELVDHFSFTALPASDVVIPDDALSG